MHSIAPNHALGYCAPAFAHGCPGKNSGVSASGWNDWDCSILWHAGLGTVKLSHMNHLSPFPGQPCAHAGTQYSRAIVAIAVHARAVGVYWVPAFAGTTLSFGRKHVHASLTHFAATFSRSFGADVPPFT